MVIGTGVPSQSPMILILHKAMQYAQNFPHPIKYWHTIKHAKFKKIYALHSKI